MEKSDTSIQISRPQNRGGLQLSTLAEMQAFAKILVASGWAPKNMTENQAIVALQFGFELGVSPMQAISNIAVVGGRASVWGDLMPALCYSSGLLVALEETMEQDAKFGLTAVCKVVRKGYEDHPVVARFSVAMAKQGGLWTKPGSWQANPARMLQMRARSFALRDAFPDVLRGVCAREEAQDIEWLEEQRLKKAYEQKPLKKIVATVIQPEPTGEPSTDYQQAEEIAVADALESPPANATTPPPEPGSLEEALENPPF